ncbi:HlyD family efflux transporter periplasmic adaptor subunit [Paraburkholderia sp. BL17N1]|uniref:HlyD family efflux transporter periplasmic adaptor subunit n=1 Tax=Paraburkholderia sp. BL17N1 TaxID=1938798 RepID=UPI000EAF9009|nr:HlyD family efflux transporter periplasmic adaptor subunit [Paraburkholderia sp. BL17N1]RKR37642.1 putative peptide zinc metalloprotease protein [Paraburkholderia sp. BL17N1]
MAIDPDVASPALREDLRLGEASPGRNGEPAWVIQDIVANRFYRIGWLEFECLLRWDKPPAQICSEIAAQTALRPVIEQVVAFRAFLERHGLLKATPETLARLQVSYRAQSWLTWRWWLHHYLFFRIPLVRPQRFLAVLVKGLDWLFTPLAPVALALASLLGIVLVLQQWDVFTKAVVESFSAEGMLSFALAIIVAKTLHELAHAIVATRLGLKVAHMGIAFVVLWPMLYTDTGESWKLKSARQRLAIASAGILCELSLAGLSTLAWALSDPGPLRNALLYLATTSWVLSLALNASPFMRFDGYFILSDLLDFPNLHFRASALARVALRRAIPGLDEPWPEPFPATQRRLLIAFEFVTWLYRLVLFLGIAVTVYLFFFKLLGIALFAVELGWFIALPVLRELQHWWANRRRIRHARKVLLGVVVVGGLVLLALPWRTQIHAEGVARAEHVLRVFVPFPARIQTIRAAGTVRPDEPLMVMDEPDIAAQMRSSEAGMHGYEARLAGLIADVNGLNQQTAVRERLRVQYEEAAAAHSEIARLSLRAPFAGRWMDVDPQWRAGQWINPKVSVGVLVDPRSWQVDAFVKQDAIQRIAVGDTARFYPAGHMTPIAGRVLAIDTTRVRQLDYPMLASRYKGPLAVSSERDALIPNPAVFHVLVQLDTAPPGLWETRGQLQIDGVRLSLLLDTGTHLIAALIRESGF